MKPHRLQDLKVHLGNTFQHFFLQNKIYLICNFSVKPREPSPKKFSASSGSKDYKSRVNYEKRDSYPPKRDRDYEPERSHTQSSISRGASNINVFNMDRERDVRDPRPREGAGGMSNNKYSAV